MTGDKFLTFVSGDIMFLYCGTPFFLGLFRLFPLVLGVGVISGTSWVRRQPPFLGVITSYAEIEAVLMTLSPHFWLSEGWKVKMPSP